MAKENGNGVFEINDLADIGSADTAEMTVVLQGKPTNWKWLWAGPGHPKTVAQRKRLDRERLHNEAQEKAAQVNGRKYKPNETEPDEDFRDRVNQLVERLVGWSEALVGGQALEFSEDKARQILSTPANVGLYIQCWEFLAAESSFIKRSGNSLDHSPSETSISAQT